MNTILRLRAFTPASWQPSAISLAMALKADLLLMDDRKGVILARSKGLRVTDEGPTGRLLT
jgi:predicted nucleic acid-binding protein